MEKQLHLNSRNPPLSSTDCVCLVYTNQVLLILKIRDLLQEPQFSSVMNSLGGSSFRSYKFATKKARK